MQRDFLTLDDVDVARKRVLIREDFNVPIADGKVQSDLRIRAALPGIKQALAAGAKVRLMSHLGRPEAGKFEEKYSLRPVAVCLKELLGIPVKFVNTGLETVISDSDLLVLYENVRFLPGETENSAVLAKQMASLCDVFVMDAFGSAHRAHASTTGVAEYAPIAVAGPLLTQEINALDQIMLKPQRPLIAIIGGAKVSTKLDVLSSLTSIANSLIIGGGMANTLLAALGHNVGESLYEPDLIPEAKKLFALAQQCNCQIMLPSDVVVESGEQKDITQIINNEKIMDVGNATIQDYIAVIKQAKTILWNGPLGVFEQPEFAHGTEQLARAIASSNAFSVAGGGDTITAIDKFGLSDKISYISTGGGAFLEYIEGKQLPSIVALINKGKQ